jgi:hypothetical protein
LKDRYPNEIIFKMKDKSNQTLYSQMQRFANITKNLIRRGNIERAKRCLNVAEEMYEKGTEEIKSTVVNVYVFSVSTFLEIHNCTIGNFFPKSLKTEYYKQVNASGI